MLYQNFVSFYPAIAEAGESHNNHRHTSLYRSGVADVDLEFGIGVIATGFADHTRLTVELPSVANAVTGAKFYLNHIQNWKPNYDYRNNLLGSETTNTRTYVRAFDHLKLTKHGVDYVVVEKVIDPLNPVFVRVANPDASGLQGIGFFTDTADGTNTVEIAGASWFGVDVLTYQQTRDPNITQELEAQRCGMTAGFSIAPLEVINQATVA